MTDAQVQAAAAALVEAEKTGRQCGLVSAANPGMTMEDAYAVQAAVVAAKQAEGLDRIGWKIGLTSRAMQQALNIDIPDSGVLLDDMLFEDGGTVPAGRFIQPRIECEIAFIMGADVAPDASEADIIAATEWVAPSLEILDTRIKRVDEEGRTRVIFDTISDNAANAGLVLGPQRFRPAEVDLPRVGAAVLRDGEVEETGLGAGVLGDPVRSVAWLVRRLGEHGMSVKAGEVLLSGSFIRPVECPPGCKVEADFGAFGAVSIRFA
ncbi:2-oxo-hepta-3-ene-1,7-dioic acid hydratase [Rhodovulum sp. DZ06]|uniref:2-oxo-hepta-3-ene-1,7-dioic acid hydratase n=1 Tax=Rhodovulum sp. DZ06 TaxID=3425126 RepID=UPI003D349BE1